MYRKTVRRAGRDLGVRLYKRQGIKGRSNPRRLGNSCCAGDGPSSDRWRVDDVGSEAIADARTAAPSALVVLQPFDCRARRLTRSER
jgi:hypothetical protein